MFPINRKLPRLSTVWFVASLSLTLWLAFGRPSAQPQPAQASVNSTAIKAPGLSTAKPVSRVKPISEAQLGERTIGKNPLREQVDEELLEPDQQTWRKLTLRLPKDNGKFLTVELLRPLDWIEDEEAAVGETIFLDLEEMGAIGDADVVSIEPCPPIQPGKGNVITGRFIHEVDQGDVVELRFAQQSEATRVTKNHPYWSVDRQQFIPAAELREGEQVESLTGPTHVASITPSDYSGPVYNLEINGEHVYRVGSLGLLAHNACAVRPYAPQATNGGHHIFAKSAFDGLKGYNPLQALAIPKSEIARLGLRHLDAGGITAVQRTLFDQLKASGKANTLKAHAKIAEQALIAGGLSKGEAKKITKQALNQLTSWGITAPSRIPWN
jgi:hypothetical protein